MNLPATEVAPTVAPTMGANQPATVVAPSTLPGHVLLHATQGRKTTIRYEEPVPGEDRREEVRKVVRQILGRRQKKGLYSASPQNANPNERDRLARLVRPNTFWQILAEEPEFFSNRSGNTFAFASAKATDDVSADRPRRQDTDGVPSDRPRQQDADSSPAVPAPDDDWEPWPAWEAVFSQEDREAEAANAACSSNTEAAELWPLDSCGPRTLTEPD